MEIDLHDKTIEDIHPSEAIVFCETTALNEILVYMQSNKVGSIILEKEGALSGILTESDFIFKLGLKLPELASRPASEFMTKDPLSLTLDKTFDDCMLLISRREFRHIPVVDSNSKVTHVVAIKDLLRFIYSRYEDLISPLGTVEDWKSQAEKCEELDLFDQNKQVDIFHSPLRQIVAKEPILVDNNLSLLEVFQIMVKNKVRVVAVTEYETRIVGVVTERDFLYKVFGKLKIDDPSVKISCIMTKNPILLTESHLLGHAINNMTKYGYRNNLIVNEDAQAISVLSMLGVLKNIAKDFGIYDPYAG